MINAVLIMFFVLGILLSLCVVGSVIATIYKLNKRKQQEKEWKDANIKNDFEEIRHRLDCHSETIGQMNWKLSEMEDKLNEKKSNRTKRNK